MAGKLLYVAGTNNNDLLQADPDIARYLTPDGGMNIGNNGQVELPGGTFYLTYLELGNNAELFVAPGAIVYLFVESWIRFGNNSSIDNDPAHPERLYILTGAASDAGEEVVIRNNTELGLFLFAPYADIELDNNAALFGGVICRSLTLLNNTEILQPVVELP